MNMIYVNFKYYRNRVLFPELEVNGFHWFPIVSLTLIGLFPLVGLWDMMVAFHHQPLLLY